MINLEQAKKQALNLSTKDKNKIYIIKNGENDYFTCPAPYNGSIGYCLDGEFIPVNNTQLNIIEMAKTSKKSAAKKTAPKKVAKKVVAKKVAAPKKEALKKSTSSITTGKVVTNLTVGQILENIAAGKVYVNISGRKQTQGYFCNRPKDALVTNVYEIITE